MKVTADRIESVVFPEFLEVPVYKITNLRISNDLQSRTTVVFKSKVFLFQFDFFLFHQVHEIAGQFEVLKSVLPDIRSVFVQQNVSHHYGFSKVFDNDLFFNTVKDIGYAKRTPETMGQNTHKYFEGLVEMYKKDAVTDSVYNLNAGNYEFQEVYFMFEGGIPLFSNRPNGILQHDTDLLRDHQIVPYWQEPDYMTVYLDKSHRYYSWHMPAMRGYKHRIDSMVSYDGAFPKKIYISRKDVKARYERLIQEIPDEGSVRFFKSRTFDEADFLEPYFISKGYTPIVFQGMPLLEQFKYVKSATHIAGLAGSAFVNFVACSPGTNVYEIHVDANYVIDYTYLCEIAGAKNHRVLLQDCNSDHAEMRSRLDQAGV